MTDYEYDDGLPLDQSRKTGDLKSFSYLENGKVTFSNVDTVKSTNSLDAGHYELKWLDHPKSIVEVKQIKHKENLPIYEFRNKDKMDALVAFFFSKEKTDILKSLGFVNKTGVLLYGAEGTGKTSIVKYYCNMFVENSKALVFYMVMHKDDLKEVWDFLVEIRKVQSNPIIVVFDEIEVICQEKENELKTMLDGHLSINDCLVFGTTNYYSKIPDTIRNRPSRFKYCFNIDGIEDEGVIIKIIKDSFPNRFDDKTLKTLAAELKGSSLDDIKHLCLDRIFSMQGEMRKKNKIGF